MAISSVEPTGLAGLRENLWLRALVLPVAIVLAGLVISLIWAHFETYVPDGTGGNDSAAGAVALAMLIAPVVGVVSTGFGVFHRPLSGNERTLLLLMSVVGAAVAVVIVGPFALLIAIAVACDGDEGCLS